MTTKTEKKPRIRRTPEQMIADLEAKIADVKNRAESRKAKKTDEGKAMHAAIKALDRAIEASGKSADRVIESAAQSARAILAKAMVEVGARVPS